MVNLGGLLSTIELEIRGLELQLLAAVRPVCGGCARLPSSNRRPAHDLGFDAHQWRRAEGWPRDVDLMNLGEPLNVRSRGKRRVCLVNEQQTNEVGEPVALHAVRAPNVTPHSDWNDTVGFVLVEAPQYI